MNPDFTAEARTFFLTSPLTDEDYEAAIAPLAAKLCEMFERGKRAQEKAMAPPAPLASDGDTPLVQVAFNGRVHEVPDGREFSVRDVIAMAYGIYAERGPTYTVSYFRAAGKPENGQLEEGQTVRVQDGTAFSIDRVW